MVVYGIPYILEDKTGLLTGSDFIDTEGRMHLVYRCTARDSLHTVYGIYDASPYASYVSSMRALVLLDFGPNNKLGTVGFGPTRIIPMQEYLVKASSSFGGPKLRTFIAADGREYRWTWHSDRTKEWTCTNDNGYLIAAYTPKVPGEPHYPNSSGCSLTVDEGYGKLAGEMLASLMVLRHMVQYNL